MKARCEGEEFTPSFSVGDPKISAKKADIVNDDKGTFGLDTKNNANQSYSHLRSHIRKKKTRRHRLGVNPKIWWRSRPPKYLSRKMGR